MALQDARAIAGGRLDDEAFVQRVVNHLDAIFGQREDARDLALCGLAHRQNPGRARQRAPGQPAAHGLEHAALPHRLRPLRQVMDGHDHRTACVQRRIEPGHV